MLIDHGLEILTEDQCLELLEEEELGRLGVSVGALPAIFPVTYRMSAGDIVFRTGDGLKRRAAIEGNVVGFEVDHIDPLTGTGWSVLAVGVAKEIADDRSDAATSVQPWAGGDRTHVIRIHPELISGRRIVPGG